MGAIGKHGRGGGWLGRPRRLGWLALARWSVGMAAVAALAVPAASAPAAAVSKPAVTDQFLAVSCPASQLCVAVGNASGNDPMLAAQWNGSQWSVMQVPLPAGAASGGLTGVSCTSATACTAVGFDAKCTRWPSAG